MPRKAQWFNWQTPATHSFLGPVQITHRSDHGHYRGTVVSTGQHLEMCNENVTLPRPAPLGRVSKGASGQRKKRQSRLSVLTDQVLADLGII